MKLLQHATEGREEFIRPSNLWRLALCEGAAIMSAAAAAQGERAEVAQEAETGTLAHECVQKAATDAAKETAPDWESYAAMAYAYAQCAGLDQWTRRCCAQTIEFYGRLVDKYKPGHILVEHPLDMRECGMERSGTSDLVLVAGNVVVIVDLKAGFLDQGEADDHDQMASYAAAAAVEFRCDDVHVYLWQPRNPKGKQATAAGYNAKALRAAAAWARSVTALARKPRPPLTAGYLQCATCPALLRCKAVKEYIMDAIEAIEIMGEPLDAEAWGRAVGAAKLAEKWAEQWRAKGKERLKQGEPVEGFRLTAGTQRKFIDNLPLVIQKLQGAGFGAELLAACSISVGKLSNEAQEVIAENIGTTTNEPSLVAEKRGKK